MKQLGGPERWMPGLISDSSLGKTMMQKRRLKMLSQQGRSGGGADAAS